MRKAKKKNRRLKNRHLTAKFAHAQPRPLQTECNQILHVGQVVDVITDAKFYKNRLRGFGVTGPTYPQKRHFLYLTFIALTTVSALLCCTVITVFAR